jgi:Tol biopolymer transport system component
VVAGIVANGVYDRRSGSDEIWLRSQAGDFERPLVTAQDFPKEETYLLGSPTFSPDGQRVAYYREGPSSNHIWISPVAGGPPVELSSCQESRAGSADLVTGRQLDRVSTRLRRQVRTLDSDEDACRHAGGTQVVVSDIVPLSPVTWSPNGAWIAYSGREGLSIVAPDGASAHAITDEPWMAYAWSEDSRRLFGIRPSDDFKHLTLTSVDVVTRSEHVLQQT